MRSRVLSALPATASILMLVVGAYAAVHWLGGAYILMRNASDTCMIEPSPPGAVMYEGAIAGTSAQLLPIAGTVCTWNRVDDNGTFDTLIPHLYWTGDGWVAVVAISAGTAGFTTAMRRQFPAQVPQS